MADVAFDLAALLGASRHCQVPNIAAGDSIQGFVVGCVHVHSERCRVWLWPVFEFPLPPCGLQPILTSDPSHQ